MNKKVFKKLLYFFFFLSETGGYFFNFCEVTDLLIWIF